MKYSVFLERAKPGGKSYAYGRFLSLLYTVALKSAQLAGVCLFFCAFVCAFPEILVVGVALFLGLLAASVLLLGLLTVLAMPLAYQDCVGGFWSDLFSFIAQVGLDFLLDAPKPCVFLIQVLGGIILAVGVGVGVVGLLAYNGVSALVRGIKSYFAHAKSLYDPVRLNERHADAIPSDALSPGFDYEPIRLIKGECDSTAASCTISLRKLMPAENDDEDTEYIKQPVCIVSQHLNQSNELVRHYDYFERESLLEAFKGRQVNPNNNTNITLADIIPVYLADPAPVPQ